MEIEDITSGFYDDYVQKEVPKAYQIDARSAPRTLGTMNAVGRRYHERIFRNREFNS